MRIAALLLILAAAPVAAQSPRPIAYELRFPNAAHHEAEITVTFPAVPAGPLHLRMSRSSPGRYAAHEFAKNVYQVRAQDGAGRPLRVTRTSPQQWTVTGHNGTVRVSYTLFADRADGTYSGIDRTHAHLNMPATLMWARGLERRPATVTFADLPAGWAVATQLRPGPDSLTFSAANLQLLMDAPIEVSDHDLRAWTVVSGGLEQTIRLAIHHTGTRQEVDRFVEQIRKVVLEQEAVFGELPAFDHGVYTFLADYLPHASGDGMEHRNSTVLTSTGALASAMPGLLGTVSHEFFHAWNVERIRPRALEPFSFLDANLTGELWLAEGVTSYYGPLTIHRAGLSSLETFARGLGGGVNTVLNAPGRRIHSPREMSMMAPFVDAATSIDPTNFANTFISYYTWGAALGLALDLTLRSRFDGLTMDDYLRDLWQVHGRTERPYTNEDARAALARVTRDTAFAHDFWRRYIEGREAPDFAGLLAHAGLLVRQVSPDAAWLGDQGFQARDGRVTVAGPTLAGQPLYEAGLDRGDRIVSLDGRPIAATADVDSVLAQRRPGDAIPVTFESRGQTVEGTVVLAASPRVEVVPFETAGREVTDAIRAFRAAWLGTRVK